MKKKYPEKEGVEEILLPFCRTLYRYTCIYFFTEVKIIYVFVGC